MQATLRRAHSGDAPALLSVKNQIRLTMEQQTDHQKGGFLLGTSLQEYQQFIEKDLVWVSEGAEKIFGFAIVLRHESLIGSLLLQRAEKVQWAAGFQAGFSAGRFAFFEQLGLLPEHQFRVYAKYLAFLAVWHTLKDHDALFTTVLQFPIQNKAALPFIQISGFELAGRVDEIYPEYGHIQSDVYCLEKEQFQLRLNQPNLKRFYERAQRDGYLPHQAE